MANEKRLIDAEQAKRATYEEVFWTESEQAVVRNFLAKLPKADAVEVVRCKDCKHLYCCSAIDRMFYCRHPMGLKGMPNIVEENPFCPYGERKDNDNT